jgi:hypothetical protein
MICSFFVVLKCLQFFFCWWSLSGHCCWVLRTHLLEIFPSNIILNKKHTMFSCYWNVWTHLLTNLFFLILNKKHTLISRFISSWFKTNTMNEHSWLITRTMFSDWWRSTVHLIFECCIAADSLCECIIAHWLLTS